MATVSTALRRPGVSKKLVLRGGAGGEEEPEEPPKENVVAGLLDQLPPGVRYHLFGIAATTVVALSGLVDAEKTFTLDVPSTIFRFQLWRPVTAACFLGTPSMTWATSIFLVIKYGCELEREVGSAAYAKFLILQVLLLVIIGSAAGLPLISESLVTAIIYASSRLHPFADIVFQFGTKIKYWMLPYGLMVVSMLEAKSIAAVIPHVVGVLAAHVHHFFAVVWPRISKELDQGPSLLSSSNKLKPSPKKKK